MQTSHDLMDLYTRISAKAEETQDLLLDTRWEGVTKVRSPPLVSCCLVGAKEANARGNRRSRTNEHGKPSGYDSSSSSWSSRLSASGRGNARRRGSETPLLLSLRGKVRSYPSSFLFEPPH